MAALVVLLVLLPLPLPSARAADAYCVGLKPADLSSADFAACGLAMNELWGSNANLYADKKCTNAACQRLLAAVGAANPSDCLVGAGDRFWLRANVLEPLAAKCAALKTATDAPTTTTTAPTTTTTPSTTTTAPTKAPPPGTTTMPTPRPRPSTSSGDGSNATPGTTTSLTNTSSAATDTAPTEGTSVPPPTFATDTSATTKAKETTSATPWIIGSIAAVVGVVAAVLSGLFLRRRRRDRAATRTQTRHTTAMASGTAPSTATSGSGPHAGSDTFVPQEHHHHMDAMLHEDRKLETWRLFTKQIHDKTFLGKGSHAFVHLVELPDGTLLASKRLARDQATPKHLKQLLAEIHIVATLSHQSIVQFKGVTWTNAMDFQVLFEYMRGGDLRQHLDKHPRPQSRVVWTRLKLQMALSIAEGLAYAHSFSSALVHRDLKSRNILLTENLRAKISDFGVSRFQSENDTMTTGVGTNRWLAPEVLIGGGTYNEKCDIYSFGVVMTELDTHEVPLEKEIRGLRSSTIGSHNKSELWVLREIANGTLRPRMLSSGPPEVRKLVEQCLSLNPKDRPDALEVSYRLRKLIASIGVN